MKKRPVRRAGSRARSLSAKSATRRRGNGKRSPRAVTAGSKSTHAEVTRLEGEDQRLRLLIADGWLHHRDVADAVRERARVQEQLNQLRGGANVTKQATTKATDQLTDLRAQLAAAEAELANATGALDVDATVAARERVATLREFVAQVERSSTLDRDADANQRASEWLAEHARRVEAGHARVAEAQQEVRKHIAPAVAAIKREAAAREALEADMLAAEILAARFGLRGVKKTQLPPVEDWVTHVLNVTDSMRPSRRARKGLLVVNRACDTPEEVRRNTLRAVSEWTGRHGKSLPPEVREILDAAPIPAEALTVSNAPVNSDPTGQASAVRALSSLPGGAGVGVI